MQVLEAMHKLGWQVGLLQPESIVMAPEAHIVDFSCGVALGGGEHHSKRFLVVLMVLSALRIGSTCFHDSLYAEASGTQN